MWRRAHTAVGLAGGPRSVVDGAQGPIRAAQHGRVAGRAGRVARRAAGCAVVAPGQVAWCGVAAVIRRAAVVGLDAIARARLVAVSAAYVRARLRSIAGSGLAGRTSIPGHQVFTWCQDMSWWMHIALSADQDGVCSSLTHQKVCEMGCVACHLFGGPTVRNGKTGRGILTLTPTPIPYP